MAYLPIPGAKGFSPASWFGGQHWGSDWFGPEGSPSTQGSGFVETLNKIVPKEDIKKRIDNTPMIERPGVKTQIDSLIKVGDYENLKKLADRDSTFYNYIKKGLKF